MHPHAVNQPNLTTGATTWGALTARQSRGPPGASRGRDRGINLSETPTHRRAIDVVVARFTVVQRWTKIPRRPKILGTGA
jgi:hypothetical protein